MYLGYFRILSTALAKPPLGAFFLSCPYFQILASAILLFSVHDIPVLCYLSFLFYSYSANLVTDNKIIVPRLHFHNSLIIWRIVIPFFLIWSIVTVMKFGVTILHMILAVYSKQEATMNYISKKRTFKVIHLKQYFA